MKQINKFKRTEQWNDIFGNEYNIKGLSWVYRLQCIKYSKRSTVNSIILLFTHQLYDSMVGLKRQIPWIPADKVIWCWKCFYSYPVMLNWVWYLLFYIILFPTVKTHPSL